MAGEDTGNRRRVVLVTGGEGGIGSSVVEWFSSRGERVVSCDLALPANSRSAGRVAKPPPDRSPGRSNLVWHLFMDVTEESSVEGGLAAVYAAWGQVDVLVHTAGAVGSGALVDIATDEWDRVLRLNLTGAFLVARATIPRLAVPAKMVFLSSVNARTGGNELSGAAYAAGKAGVEALTRHLARVLAPGVQVNAVAPGPVRTAMLARLTESEMAALVSQIPAGRVAEPGEVADLIGYLCSPSAGYVTGAVIPQNGGQWIG